MKHKVLSIEEELKHTDYLFFYIEPKDTNYINRILEGYEYLGVMTTLDDQSGLTMLRTTEGTRKLAKKVLLHVGRSVRFLS